MSFNPFAKARQFSISELQEEMNRMFDRMWHRGIATGPLVFTAIVFVPLTIISLALELQFSARLLQRTIPFRDALETQDVCDAVLKSGKTGVWETVGA